MVSTISSTLDCCAYAKCIANRQIAKNTFLIMILVVLDFMFHKITNTLTKSEDDVLYLTVEMKYGLIEKIRTASLSAFLILLSIALYSCQEDDSTDVPNTQNVSIN